MRKDRMFPDTKPQCAECKSYQVYFGKKKQEFTCRVCGFTWLKKQVPSISEKEAA